MSKQDASSDRDRDTRKADFLWFCAAILAIIVCITLFTDFVTRSEESIVEVHPQIILPKKSVWYSVPDGHSLVDYRISDGKVFMHLSKREWFPKDD